MPRYPDVIYQTELVYRYIQQAAEVHGISSANAYYRWMHEHDLPVARAVVREGWSEYWSKQQYRTLIERWPDERPIPRAWIVDRESGARDNYVAMYHLSGVDSATGQEISRAVYVGVDQQPSAAAQPKHYGHPSHKHAGQPEA